MVPSQKGNLRLQGGKGWTEKRDMADLAAEEEEEEREALAAASKHGWLAPTF